MKRETAERVWPSTTPPGVATARGGPALRWELTDVTQLPGVRAQVRQQAGRTRDDSAAELRDQLILALDEMASNALRHGGRPVVAALRMTDDGYLIEVSDGAPDAPPVPAVDRDPSEGGLGLHLVAELATDHGWYVRGPQKHVWALLPRH